MDKDTQGSRREIILRTFTTQVAKKGYDVTTMAQLADELQISKGTIMYHFGSKDKMFQEMALGYMQRRLHELEAIYLQETSSPARIRTIIMSLIKSYQDDRDAAIAFSREFMRLADEPLMDEVRGLRQTYLFELQSVIEQGVREGVLRTKEPRVVALQLIGMCNWIWTWFRTDGRLTPEDIGSIFADTVLNGLIFDSNEVG